MMIRQFLYFSNPSFISTKNKEFVVDNLLWVEQNSTFFLEKYYQHISPIADTLAWWLMPNHFHLLIRIKDVDSLRTMAIQNLPKFKTLEGLISTNDDVKLSHLLSKQFPNFFSSYTQAFNKVYKRRGSLFIKNFKRKPVHTENYLLQLVAYIHLNPVKHGFVSSPNDWPWSSFETIWRDQADFAALLFGTQETFNLFHSDKKYNFEAYQKIETDILKG